ncbi:putative ABC transporter peptide-binding protein YtcQ [Paenibacillus sp. J45TS6]|uniref:extracellular solute-binding protein n=1 Tax=Paenibacillus sp. J45TS6 TaxID=2807196 RepID=UPI001B260A54|nr:extracellular solute-binding protein [Paenibacillus sp. J45TS6]GIP43483.1 putative ABC transporter peptide-binding protein YtcQ [Paenibacillus sp. J45TS6]
MNKMNIALTVFLSFQLLYACSPTNEVNKVFDPLADDNTTRLEYEEMGLSKYDPPIKVSFVRETSAQLDELIRSLPGQTLNDNTWSQLYEEVLGIQITYDWTAKGDLFAQKFSVDLSSGNIPDVVRVDAEQLRLLSNAGYIQDLTNVFDTYATPLTKEILNQEGSGPFEAATIDRKLMGIPETDSSIESAQVLWIRTDWLERLNLEPPQTMDELIAISKAFTERDPDQNEQNDTFGLAATQYLWDPVMGLTSFMAGYDAFPMMWIHDDSGKLTYGGIQSEVKSALLSLQNMYRNGYLDSEFAMKNGIKVKEQVAKGKIGMLYGEQWGSFLVQVSRESDSNADWRAFPIVSVSGEAPKVPLKFNTTHFIAVKRGVEHPEAIIKMFNLHLEKNWGKTAEYEKYYSSPYPVWQLSPITPYPARKNMEAFQQLKEARITGDQSKLNEEAKAIQKNITTYLSGSGNIEIGWGWERTYGEQGAMAIIDQYEKNNQLLYESFVGTPTETMIEKQSILNEIQLQVYMDIILGRPIEEFDRFVEQWKKLGGDQITEEVNQWFLEQKP